MWDSDEVELVARVRDLAEFHSVVSSDDVQLLIELIEKMDVRQLQLQEQRNRQDKRWNAIPVKAIHSIYEELAYDDVWDDIGNDLEAVKTWLGTVTND